MNIAKVAVENAAYSFDTEFSYRIPDKLLEAAKPGCRVTVPFGRTSQKRQGMILSTEYAEPTQKLKCIASVPDTEPVLNAEGIRLVRFLKERTFCTLFEAVRAVLPSGLGRKTVMTFAAVPESEAPDPSLLTADERTVYAYLCAKGTYLRAEKVWKDTGLSADSGILTALCGRGFAVRNVDTVRNVSDLTRKSVRLTGAEAPVKLTAKQQAVLDVLRDVGSASVREVCYFTGYTDAVVKALAKKGLVECFEAEIFRNPYANADAQPQQSEIALSAEQTRAYESLLHLYRSGNAAASLLYGVTGSGKTKVYMKMIDRVLEDGRGVILLVPEISLTPQALHLFHARYGKKVAVFHSALSVGERLDEWKRVKCGEARIVVGTRSAVFAPFENIGLIVVDEEQESAYKSENAPRYNAKDVARFRCAEHRALLILASATPSIESFAAAEKGRYVLNTLSERYGDALLPEVVTVDMIAERKCGNESEISRTLAEALRQTIEVGRQAILLMNRRGYNTFASCTSCGHVVTCPSCSISMTYHRANGRLMCHYCGYSVPFTPTCPECGEQAVRYSGFGTQKIEDELSRLLPEARVLRMDTDTTMSRFAHEDKLRLFAEKQYDILLGTQMVAKGLDFENVTLVGVISVDSLLFNDDYRALERTFSLLTQVVGRSGRGQYSGKAIIQTTAPENDVLSMAARQDYEEFYRTEIGIRRLLIYPPYCDLCVLAFIGAEELFVRGAAKAFLEKLTALSEGEYRSEKLIVLGPAPAKVLRVSDKYRYRLIVKCKNSARLRVMIAELLRTCGKDKRFAEVTVTADINPESIL